MATDASISDLIRSTVVRLPVPEDGTFGEQFDGFVTDETKVVLLGEASHGTSEFYRARAAITKRLVEKHGFNIVAVEADWYGGSLACINPIVNNSFQGPTPPASTAGCAINPTPSQPVPTTWSPSPVSPPGCGKTPMSTISSSGSVPTTLISHMNNGQDSMGSISTISTSPCAPLYNISNVSTPKLLKRHESDMDVLHPGRRILLYTEWPASVKGTPNAKKTS